MSPAIVMEALWQRSDLKLNDIDLFWPYDGFTSTAAFWTLAAGWCKPGELYDFLRTNWDKGENRLKVNGRTLFSANGGNLSFGRSMGSHFFHEAVLQLRGEAGTRQVPNAKTALMAIGNFYSCADATLLRAD
jgi:hypothetical protein